MRFIFGRPTEEEQVATCEFMGQHQQYSTALVERLIEDPAGEGFLRHCVRAFIEDPTDLDVNYLSGLAMNGLAAAHETTSNAAGQALLALLSDRDSWDELCAEPSLIPGAVEETMRIAPSRSDLAPRGAHRYGDRRRAGAGRLDDRARARLGQLGSRDVPRP